MKVKVNGEDKTVKEAISITDLLSDFSIKPEAVVVELNLKIISKDSWDKTILNENDSVEIVRFVGGG
jgi:thiamine biosynthesis protein ThiS